MLSSNEKQAFRDKFRAYGIMAARRFEAQSDRRLNRFAAQVPTSVPEADPKVGTSLQSQWSIRFGPLQIDEGE